jgi:DNA-binding XRE family transcriptional regulator
MPKIKSICINPPYSAYLASLPQHRGGLPECLNTLGDHIRKKRLNLGLTQREAAHLIGVEQCSVYNWEKRGMKPAQRVQTAIIDFLGYGSEPERQLAALRAGPGAFNLMRQHWNGSDWVSP